MEIASSEGIGAILKAMKVTPNNAKVNYYGCWALANIVWSEGGVKHIAIKLVAIEILQSVLARFTNHSQVVEKATLALTKLQSDNSIRRLRGKFE